MKSASKSLDCAEWDFYEVPDDETLLAFYWEYGRASESLKSEVEQMREARDSQGSWHHVPWTHQHCAIVKWLAPQAEFPRVSWLALKAKTIQQVRERRAETAAREKQINAGRHKFIKLPAGVKCSLPCEAPDAPVETGEWTCRALGPHPVNLRQTIGCQHVWGGDVSAVRAWHERLAKTTLFPADDPILPRPNLSTFEIHVPWQLSDKEILKHVQFILESHRPKQFKEYAKTKAQSQLGFNITLPFRKGAALQWLGVWRCRNAVSSWREFFSRYTKKEFTRGAERARQKDCDQAERILAWLDGKAPLRKSDFQ